MESDPTSTSKPAGHDFTRAAESPPFDIELRPCPACQLPMEDSLRSCPWCDALVSVPDRHRPPVDEDFVVGAPPTQDESLTLFTRIKRWLTLTVIVLLFCQGVTLMFLGGYVFLLFSTNPQAVQGAIPLFAVGVLVTAAASLLAQRFLQKW